MCRSIKNFPPIDNPISPLNLPITVLLDHFSCLPKNTVYMQPTSCNYAQLTAVICRHL